MHTCTRVRARVGAHSALLTAPPKPLKKHLLCMHMRRYTSLSKHQVLAWTQSRTQLSSRKCSHFAAGGMKASYQGSSRCKHLPLPTHRSDTAHTHTRRAHAAPTWSMCRVADRRQRAASAGSSACAVRSSLARIALSVSSTTTDKDSCAYLVWRAQHKGANGSSLASSLSLISYYYSHTMKLRSQCLT